MDFGIKPQFYINDILSTIGPSNYGFTMTDSIYRVFPELEFVLAELSGLSLELGTFTRGIPLKIVLEDEDNILESKFIVNHRDNVQQQTQNSIGGNLKIGAIHESYTQSREKVSIYHNKKISDIVKELFPEAETEDTSAKVAIYQFDEPYAYTKNILLDIADSPTGTPFVFFRDLAGKIVFKSVGDIVQQSPVAKLSLSQNSGTETVKNTMNTFLPFDSRLAEILDKLAIKGNYLDKLTFKTEDVTVVDFMEDFIPIIADTVKNSSFYFGRQFNPDMDYASARAALWIARLKSGFLSDKAFATVPFDGKLLCGNVVDVEVFLQDADGEPMISETFSGKWIVEESKHTWNGAANMAITSLVLSRSSYKPVSDSLLETDSYKGK